MCNNFIKENHKKEENMYNVTNLFDQILNRSINDFVGTDFNLTIPAANIVEHEDNYQIILAAPGLEKTDFTVRVEKDIIHVGAEKTNLALPEGTQVKRKEFNYSKFKRNFTLPENVNTNTIKAEYTDGILTITLFKKAEVEHAATSIVVE
jgi:HSP20 family protein